MRRRNRGAAARRVTVAALVLLGMAAVVAARAAEVPLRPGIGAVDRRVAVDVRQAPWNAVAKVQTTTGVHCTGALIAPDIVLTAAHCLYNRLTRRMLPAVSLHVLIGASAGAYRWHRLVAGYAVGPGYDGPKGGPQRTDWARLTLDAAVPGEVAPLPLAPERASAGTPLALPGYNQDHAQILMADMDCHVAGSAIEADDPFFSHDCDATRGTSGGPVLTRRGGGWAILGINIAAGPELNLALSARAFAP